MKVLQNFQEADLRIKFFVMSGLPGETIGQSMETIDFALKVMDEFPIASLAAMMTKYHPFPGTALFDKSCALGFKAPVTLLDYAKTNAISNNIEMPWLTKKEQKDLGVVALMSCFLTVQADTIPFTGAKRLLFKILRKMYIFRLRKKLFLKTPELMILHKIIF